MRCRDVKENYCSTYVSKQDKWELKEGERAREREREGGREGGRALVAYLCVALSPHLRQLIFNLCPVVQHNT